MKKKFSYRNGHTGESTHADEDLSPVPKQGTPEQKSPLPPQGNVYAVIIGINKHQDPRIPRLGGAVNDAQDFSDVLTNPNYGGVPQEHIKLLLDEQATRQNIKTEIGQWLRRNATDKDTVFIYYAGQSGHEYWVTYDANCDNLYATALGNNEIVDMLSRVQSKRMITFLDCCYSPGTVNRTDHNRHLQIENPWNRFTAEGHVIISASDENQVSVESEAHEQGVFTHHLLEGLKGRADVSPHDGVVHIKELWDYVYNNVQATVKKMGKEQTPVAQGPLTAFSKSSEPVFPGKGSPSSPQGNMYAVIIGIGKFQDERIPLLRFAVNDAQGFYEMLIDPNYGGVPQDHIKLLLDEQATRQNIKTAIGQWLRDNATDKDTVFIYYSGHGQPEEEDTYWVTYDANKDNLYATALGNNEIEDMLSRVQSKRMLIFLDACHSAATVNRTNHNHDTKIGEGNVVISASSENQEASETFQDQHHHGLFTYHLLEGLKGEADIPPRDGVVDVKKLWDYVYSKVVQESGYRQTPVVQGPLTAAGIPLTIDRTYLKQQREQARKDNQVKLQALYQKKKITEEHFTCASKMLETGMLDAAVSTMSDNTKLLQGLLSGEILPNTFRKKFKCQL